MPRPDANLDTYGWNLNVFQSLSHGIRRDREKVGRVLGVQDMNTLIEVSDNMVLLLEPHPDDQRMTSGRFKQFLRVARDMVGKPAFDKFFTRAALTQY